MCPRCSAPISRRPNQPIPETRNAAPGRAALAFHSKGVSTMTIAHEESERNAREPTIVAQWELNRRESVRVGGAPEIADNRPVTFCTVIGDATYCDARYTRTTGSLSNFFAREELMLRR